MIVTRLELVDFRNYVEASFQFHHGITAIVGLNGQGKTNLAEALAYLASLDSFRGAPTDALIRVGAQTAVVRATVLHPDGRELLVELELSRHGRTRVQVNKQKLGRSRELLGVMRVTVFSPDDLALVKGSPQERRRFMDDTLVALALKYDALRLELDRIVKQRNTLLKQAAGRLTDELDVTLDVWDAKFAQVGDQFGHARAVLIARLSPMVAEAYEQLADRPSVVDLRYEPAWRAQGFVTALAAARGDDVRRGVSTVGPHRDDVELFIGGLAKNALRAKLDGHKLVGAYGGTPFPIPKSGLEAIWNHKLSWRGSAWEADFNQYQITANGQVVLTTAGGLPAAAHPDAIVRIESGAVLAE